MLGSPDAAAVDNVLLALQSGNTATIKQAEQQVEAWSTSSDFLKVLMSRAHLAQAPGSRQLAATLLSWRIPRLWSTLPDSERESVQAALLDCFSKCQEPLVLRALGEACNALSQTLASRHNMLWEGLLQLIGALLSGQSAAHRRAALELLAALCESLGARLQQHYANMGQTLVTFIHDADDAVRIAALGLVSTAVSSWFIGDEDLQHWQGAASATLEVAAGVLKRSAGDDSGPQVLTAALRALSRLVPALKAPALATASAELACLVLSTGKAQRNAEQCHTQALQVLRAIARTRSKDVLTEQLLLSTLPVVCRAAKDEAPDLDDLDEVDLSVQTARDCIREFAKADPQRVVPVVVEAAERSAQSKDAMDRASAIHTLAFAFSGGHDATSGWAVPFARAVGDSTIWVRQAAAEGMEMMSEALTESPAKTEGVLMVLVAMSEHLPAETDPGLLRKCATAMSTAFKELATDEIAPVLERIVQAICRVLTSSTQAASHAVQAAVAGGWAAESEAVAVATSAIGAVVALVGSLGEAATTGSDLFAPLAPVAAAALLPLLRARLGDASAAPGIAPGLITPALLAACLDAAGPVTASAWGEASCQAMRDEFATIARQVLPDEKAPSQVRASAHNFFSAVAFASFEEFSPQLAHVVPPAVQALHVGSTGEEKHSNGRRAVRTAQHEELVAAINALGVYAVAVGASFAAYLPTVLPALRKLAHHASPEVRIAVASSLERIGRMLDGLSAVLPAGSPDRAGAAAMALEVAHALCDLINNRQLEGQTALRRALQTKEDLAECAGFISLLGQEAGSALAGAGNGQNSDDIESSVADEEDALEGEH